MKLGFKKLNRFCLVVGYPYGGFMYTFVGKMVPFVIIGALVLVDMGLYPSFLSFGFSNPPTFRLYPLSPRPFYLYTAFLIFPFISLLFLISPFFYSLTFFISSLISNTIIQYICEINVLFYFRFLSLSLSLSHCKSFVED